MTSPPQLNSTLTLTKKREIWIQKTHLLTTKRVFQSQLLMFQVVQALVSLVNEPEPDHPLRGDLAEEFSKDRKKFLKNAEEHTKKWSEKRPSD